MILLLEQSFSVSDLRNFQKEYSINLRANEEEYKTGLQLLKKESETKISKRKKSIAKWKVKSRISKLIKIRFLILRNFFLKETF